MHAWCVCVCACACVCVCMCDVCVCVCVVCVCACVVCVCVCAVWCVCVHVCVFVEYFHEFRVLGAMCILFVEIIPRLYITLKMCNLQKKNPQNAQNEQFVKIST